MLSYLRSSDITDDTIASGLFKILEDESDGLLLRESFAYYDFPVYQSNEGALIPIKILLVSRSHGIVMFACTAITGRTKKEIVEVEKSLDLAVGALIQRLILIPGLRKSRTQLKVPIVAAVYAPNIVSPDDSTDLINGPAPLRNLLHENKTELTEDFYKLILSSVAGAQALTLPKERPIEKLNENSKGVVASNVEASIANFDIEQTRSYVLAVEGPQRIRGLAGSGKTIVLTMKAALTHIRHKDATIVYTFFTKSLYQQIRNLIRHFFKQFAVGEPNWDKLKIAHAWGGALRPGFYSEICELHGRPAMTFSAAQQRTRGNPFDFACNDLLESTNLKPLYDFVFVDEGQDFPLSGLKLAAAVSKESKFVLAYDVFQNTIQPSLDLELGDIISTKKKNDWDQDIVLSTCYRNPREVIFCAHAVGLGIYGKIRQMLKTETDWATVGYEVKKGPLHAGCEVEIERPQRNSIPGVSASFSKEQIVRAEYFEDIDDELAFVCRGVAEDLNQGLLPEDILIICADDRNAKSYFSRLTELLAVEEIIVNNTHIGHLGDFFVGGQVTLATVHKAKGNEAFSVYIVGVDYLFNNPSLRNRNVLFTAMTRSKGWVAVSGLGNDAILCQDEILAALRDFPILKFLFPGAEELRMISQEAQAASRHKLKTELLLEEVLKDMTPEEIASYITSKLYSEKKRQQFFEQE